MLLEIVFRRWTPYKVYATSKEMIHPADISEIRYIQKLIIHQSFSATAAAPPLRVRAAESRAERVFFLSLPSITGALNKAKVIDIWPAAAFHYL